MQNILYNLKLQEKEDIGNALESHLSGIVVKLNYIFSIRASSFPTLHYLKIAVGYTPDLSPSLKREVFICGQSTLRDGHKNSQMANRQNNPKRSLYLRAICVALMGIKTHKWLLSEITQELEKFNPGADFKATDSYLEVQCLPIDHPKTI